MNETRRPSREAKRSLSTDRIIDVR
jgi:hypothetical protein